MERSLVGRIASLSVVAGGIAVAVFHHFASTPGGPENWFSSLGFGAPFIGVGLLALIGTERDRPELVIMSALVLWPMSVISIILIPLLLSAVVLIASVSSANFSVLDLAVSAVLASAVAATLAVVIFRETPADWMTPEGPAGSSDIITTLEAGLAVGTALIIVTMAATCRCRPVAAGELVGS